MKTTPYKHQAEEFEISKDLKTRALFWEMGTGKTKMMIDTAWHLYEKGEINALVVFAPNGVHRNWITDEVPAHGWSDDWDGLYWVSGSAKTKKSEEERNRILDHDGLIIVAINYDAARTDIADKFVNTILRERDVMMVLDESARIKNPSAQRTKKVMKYGEKAKYKRILTGTPVSNGPFDVYSQINFLDPMVWAKLGCRAFSSFKRYFGVFQRQHMGGRQFDQLVAYRRLDKLKEAIDPLVTRVTKDEVLDLPDKIYKIHPVELSAEQKRLYKHLSEDFVAVMDDDEIIDAPLAIVRLLRLQQIVCGYTGTDTDDLKLLKDNPRITALKELMEDVVDQSIVWARFQQDIDLIEEALTKMGKTVVVYDGRTSDAMRKRAIKDFRDGTADVFLANPAAAGEGLTLTEAKVVVYYNNSFRLDERLQSEDRAHRIGQDRSVVYYDLVAHGTVDEHIVAALRSKIDIASQVTGDTIRDWVK